jgi:hypothetical protein
LTFPNTGLPLRSKHPKKDVEAALQEAEAEGFRVETGRGHWGVMYCPGLENDRCPAPFWIWSTPANAANHAKQIRRYVARCPHH